MEKEHYVKRWINNENGKQEKVHVCLIPKLGIAIDIVRRQRKRQWSYIYLLEELFTTQQKAFDAYGKRTPDFYIGTTKDYRDVVKEGFYVVKPNGIKTLYFEREEKGERVAYERRWGQEGSFPTRLSALRAIVSKQSKEVRSKTSVLSEESKRLEGYKKLIAAEQKKRTTRKKS